MSGANLYAQNGALEPILGSIGRDKMAPRFVVKRCGGKHFLCRVSICCDKMAQQYAVTKLDVTGNLF